MYEQDNAPATNNQKLLLWRWVITNAIGGAVGWSLALLLFLGTFGTGALVIGFVVGFCISWAQVRFFEWYAEDQHDWLGWLLVGSLSWSVGWLVLILAGPLLLGWHYLIRSVLSFGLCGLTISLLQSLMLQRHIKPPDRRWCILTTTLGWLLGGLVGRFTSTVVYEGLGGRSSNYFIGINEAVALATAGFISTLLVTLFTARTLLTNRATELGSVRTPDTSK